jgi:hypothetical protein
MGNRGFRLRWPSDVATRLFVVATATFLISASSGIVTSTSAQALRSTSTQSMGSGGFSNTVRAHSSGGAPTCKYANFSGELKPTDPGWDCGATLTGPTSLTLGTCPKSVSTESGTLTWSDLKRELCTQPFTLSVAFSSGTPPPSGREPVGTYIATNYATFVNSRREAGLPIASPRNQLLGTANEQRRASQGSRRYRRHARTGASAQSLQ